MKKLLALVLALTLAAALALPAAAKGADPKVRWLDFELPEEVAETVRTALAGSTWTYSLNYVEQAGLLSVNGAYSLESWVFDVNTGRRKSYVEVSPVNEYFFTFTYDDGYNGYGIMDMDGKVLVDPVCWDPTYLGDGLYCMVSRSRGEAYLLNDRGKIVETYTFDDSFNFWYTSGGEEWMCSVTRDGEDGVIGPDGGMIVPFGKYESIDDVRNGLIAAMGKNGLYGVVDAEGNVLIPFEYQDIDISGDGSIVACKEDELYGVLDMEGNVRIPFKYGYLDSSDQGLFFACRDDWGDGKGGVLDADGEIVVPFEYDEIDFDISGEKQYIIAYAGEDRGLFDARGREILPAEYDDIGVWENGLIIAVKDGKCGLVDEKGTYRFGPVRGDWMYPEGDVAVVFSDHDGDEVSGVYNLAGEELLPADDYDDLDARVGYNGIIVAALDGEERKMGLFGGQGEALLPLEYDLISPLYTNEYALTDTYLVMDGRRVGLYTPPAREEEAAGEPDESSGFPWLWVGLGVGGAVILAGVVAVVVVAAKKKKKKAIPAAAEGLRFCVNCGAPLVPGSQFCRNCGKKI